MTGDTPPRIAAIVLAAGQGTRFAAASGGSFKLLAPFRGVPMVRCVVETALRSRARPVLVVTGHGAERVRQALDGLPATFAHNSAYASGLSSSLHTGLSHVPPDADGALVLLADMPLVSATLLDKLVAAFAGSRDCDAAVPTHGGRRGNPVLLARTLFPAAMRTEGDGGARKLLNASARVVEVDVADDAVAIDVDAPETLASLQ